SPVVEVALDAGAEFVNGLVSWAVLWKNKGENNHQPTPPTAIKTTSPTIRTVICKRVQRNRRRLGVNEFPGVSCCGRTAIVLSPSLSNFFSATTFEPYVIFILVSSLVRSQIKIAVAPP